VGPSGLSAPESIGRPGSLPSPVPIAGPMASAPQLIAQVTAAPDGTNTVVTPSAAQYDVTGGTAAGKNLFHSFQEFGIPAGNTANIAAPAGIQNILGRVVGGQPSNILGTLQVTGGSANLYLMNPAGILFGPGAQLNIPGAFVATTANGIRIDALPNAQWFNALGTNNYANLTGNPTGFGFNLTGATPAPISNAGQLTAKAGQSIVLVGGPVSNTGKITAPGGIGLVAAPNQTLVQLTQPGNPLSLQVALPASGVILPQDLPQLLTGGSATGTATLATGNLSTQVTQGSAGNIVGIADRQITTGAINTSTTGRRGNGGSVTLQSRSAGIDTGPILTPSSNGNGGAVTLTAAGNLNLSAVTTNSQRALTSGGAITLTGGANVQANGPIAARSGLGQGGAITITAGQGIVVDQIDASTQATGADGGNGGELRLTAQNGSIQANTLSSFATAQRGNSGNGGSIRLSATNGDVIANTLNTQTRVDELGSAGRGGDVAITVNQGNVQLGNKAQTGGINTSAISGSKTSNGGNGGNISIQVGPSGPATGGLTLAPGNRLNTSTNGQTGISGDVTLTAARINLGDQAGQSILAGPLAATATGGTLTLIGDEINFSGLLSGRSVTLQPLTPSRPINVGGPPVAGALNLEQPQLNSLKPGFERVTIGAATGSGPLQVTANLSFTPELILQSPQPGGSITTTGRILKGTRITLNAPQINRGEIQTQGELNIINGAPQPDIPAPPRPLPQPTPPSPKALDESPQSDQPLALNEGLTRSAAANSAVASSAPSPAPSLTLEATPPDPSLTGLTPPVDRCPVRRPRQAQLSAIALLQSAMVKVHPNCKPMAPAHPG
jgi:filamentous hemagglutinin family protein